MDYAASPLEAIRGHLARVLDIEQSLIDKFLVALVAKLPTALYGGEASLLARGIAGAMLSLGREVSMPLAEKPSYVARLSYVSPEDIPGNIGYNKGPIFIDKIDTISLCGGDIDPF